MLNATTTCTPGGSSTECVTLYGQSTSTDPMIVNGFSAGEIVISTFLFLILVCAMIVTYHLLFRRVKIKNQ